MSLLSYTEICELIEQGVIEGASYKNVNSASLDIHLGDTFMIEAINPHNRFVDIAAKGRPEMLPQRLSDYGNMYHLHPGQFILAQSAEVFHLPNDISAEYKLNSSLARAGVDHLNAGWCDAGWNGSVLTLEYKNCMQYHVATISLGMRAGQLVFFRHKPVPADKSYAARGRYNGDLSVSGVKTEAAPHAPK